MTQHIAQPAASSDDAVAPSESGVAPSAAEEGRWLAAEQARLEGLIHALMGHHASEGLVAGASAQLAPAGQHPADSGTETFMREVDLTLLGDLRAELDQVLRVRRRLAEGAPLICEVCHLPIPAERLEAIPAARFCLLHEERFELGGLHLSDLTASASPSGIRPDAHSRERGVPEEEDLFSTEDMLPAEDELPSESNDGEPGAEEGAITSADGEALRTEELEAELAADGLLEEEMGEGLVDLDVSAEDIESSLEELTLASSERERGEQSSDPSEEGEVEAEPGGNGENDLGWLVDRQLGLGSEAVGNEAEVDTLADGDALGQSRPRESDEFVCTECFLVKKRALLADESRQRCVDCATLDGE
ncbi:MAG: DUF4193 family protein [Acidimicrobiales bacterium]